MNPVVLTELLPNLIRSPWRRIASRSPMDPHETYTMRHRIQLSRCYMGRNSQVWTCLINSSYQECDSKRPTHQCVFIHRRFSKTKCKICDGLSARFDFYRFVISEGMRLQHEPIQHDSNMRFQMLSNTKNSPVQSLERARP
jgi:hypothetical protein